MLRKGFYPKYRHWAERFRILDPRFRILITGQVFDISLFTGSTVNILIGIVVFAEKHRNKGVSNGSYNNHIWSLFCGNFGGYVYLNFFNKLWTNFRQYMFATTSFIISNFVGNFRPTFSNFRNVIKINNNII